MQRNIDNLNGVLRSLQTRKGVLENEIRGLESATEKAKLSQKIELESLDEKIKTLTSALQPLTLDVESLRNRKDALVQEIEALATKKEELEKTMKSEEVTIDSLRRGRLEIQHENKRRPGKTRLHSSQAPAKPELRAVSKQTSHTFVCKYEGGGDWNTELSKLITQFELSLDQTKYSFSPEKIVLPVIGSRDDIEKLATALNNLEGFVNLRSKLAATRNSLREYLRARNIQKQQLDELDHVPWYKQNRSLTQQRAELSQKLAETDSWIKAISEDLKALEKVVGSDAPKN